MTMKDEQVTELLLQSLETELGGVEIYECAIECAVHPLLRREWETYLDETLRHVTVLRNLCRQFNVDTERETAGRAVVRHLGKSLVAAMELALDTGTPAAAQLVACECVVLAETKDHGNWELIGQYGRQGTGELAAALLAVYDDIEDEEDAHLYHTKGWCRELWIESLGLKAVLPPPEEVQDVHTAIGAARAQASARRAYHLGDTGPVVDKRGFIA